MTPTQAQSVKAIVSRYWPVTKKWTDDEWDVFGEACERLPLEVSQCDAALRHHKATVEKYPGVAALVKCLREVCQGPSRGASPIERDDYPNIKAYRAQLLARGERLSSEAQPADVVLAWWKQTLTFIMEMRGDVPAKYRHDFMADCANLAGIGEADAIVRWDWLMGEIIDVPVNIERAEKFAYTRKEAKRIATATQSRSMT